MDKEAEKGAEKEWEELALVTTAQAVGDTVGDAVGILDKEVEVVNFDDTDTKTVPMLLRAAWEMDNEDDHWVKSDITTRGLKEKWH